MLLTLIEALPEWLWRWIVDRLDIEEGLAWLFGEDYDDL